MFTHIHFIPWKAGGALIPTGHSAPEDRRSTFWWKFQNRNRSDRKYARIFYNGSEHRELADATTGTIYIHGHGAAGDAKISNIAKGHTIFKLVTEEEIGFDTVADRLIESGLKPTFKGKIKCWSCNSIVERLQSTGKMANKSFAHSLAGYMRGKGYVSCSYYGYLGSIDDIYHNRDGAFHRFSSLDSKGKYKVVRAKNRRSTVGIMGTVMGPGETPYPNSIEVELDNLRCEHIGNLGNMYKDGVVKLRGRPKKWVKTGMYKRGKNGKKQEIGVYDETERLVLICLFHRHLK
jgi:hypothetical protein